MKRIFLSACFLLFSLAVFAEISVYFSPDGGCTEAIINQLSKAKNNIDIMMYSFTSRPIAQELVKAKERGVKIRILLDKHQAIQKYSKGRYFLNKGIPVKYDTGAGLMHNKVAIIDGKVLITGSFNWTAQAEKYNSENLLIINDQSLIKKYQEKFEELWERGTTG